MDSIGGVIQHETSLYYAFRNSALARGESAFLHEAGAEGTRTWSYGEILHQVELLASYLHSLSFPRGARVAILSENRHEWVVVYLAVVALGLVAVPLDAQATLKEWTPILKHSEVRLLFHSEKFEGHFSKMPEGLAGLERISFGEKIEEIFRRSAGGLKEEDRPPVGESDVATLVYTSGTTGTPKGVLLTHGNLLASAREMNVHHDRSGGVAASILPFNHIYGFAALSSRILLGDAFLIFKTIKEDLLFENFARFRPYTLAGVPVLFERFARSLRQRMKKELPGFVCRWIERAGKGFLGADAENFRFFKKKAFSKIHRVFGGRISHFASGGAPIDPQLVRFFNTLGIAICQGYGLTETSPLVALCRRKAGRIGSVGKVVGGMTIRIQTPDREGVGEVWVRGDAVMQGYYLNPEATAQVIDGDGWFKTGDLGRLDADGYLYISGRLKELIVTPNGKNIYPAEIEPLFEKMHGVREVCLFGIPQKNGHGEAVHLQIVPDPDLAASRGRDALVAEIKEEVTRLSQGLPEYQRPRSVGFSEEPFPRSSSFKIKKHQVKKEWLEKGRARPGNGHAEHRVDGDDPLLHSQAALVVRKILKSLLPHPVPITSASSLELDLGLDSLTQIEFWATLEKNLHVKIPEEALARLKVVGHIVEYLLENVDLGRKARSAMHEIDVEARQKTVGSWFEILDTDPETSRAKAGAVLKSHPKLRPFFLKVFRKMFGVLCGLEVEGLENLPSGGYILAPNHECYIDNIFVASVLPAKVQKNMAVIGAKEFFDKAATRLIAKLCHTIPIDRNQVSSSVLQIGAQVLKMGKVLLIHPEGTRSPDGELLPYKTGAAILADYAQCPIVPVYIEGAHEFWPKGAKWPQKRRAISVTFGKPILPVPPHGEQTRVVQKDAQALTNRVMEQALAMREKKMGLASSTSRSERRPAGSGEDR